MIGAWVCGAYAGKLIYEARMALELGADAEDISKTIHAHPTLLLMAHHSPGYVQK